MKNPEEKPQDFLLLYFFPVLCYYQENKRVMRQTYINYMKSILLVEDDKFLSSLIKNRLEKEGFSVLYAMDGEMALDLLRSNTAEVGLVLLDIILPKKNGFEVLEEIQKDPSLSGIQVIIASNLGQDSDIERGKDLGAVDYYIKAHTSIDDLINHIRGYLLQV